MVNIFSLFNELDSKSQDGRRKEMNERISRLPLTDIINLLRKYYANDLKGDYRR